MLRNGSYSAWFRTPRGEGMGVVVLNDGKLSGGDTITAYTGSYVEDGDNFTAVIATERHSESLTSVFGFDHVDLTLTGGRPRPRQPAPGPPSRRRFDLRSHSCPYGRLIQRVAQLGRDALRCNDSDDPRLVAPRLYRAPMRAF